VMKDLKEWERRRNGIRRAIVVTLSDPSRLIC